jgi:hypothetical protein
MSNWLATKKNAVQDKYQRVLREKAIARAKVEIALAGKHVSDYDQDQLEVIVAAEEKKPAVGSRRVAGAVVRTLGICGVRAAVGRHQPGAESLTVEDRALRAVDRRVCTAGGTPAVAQACEDAACTQQQRCCSCCGGACAQSLADWRRRWFRFPARQAQAAQQG